MVEVKYHDSEKGVILAKDLFPDKEVPIMDLRNLELPAEGVYLLYFRENCAVPNKGVFDYDTDNKQYFFKTQKGKTLTFEKPQMLVRALGEELLKFKGLDKAVAEKMTLSYLLDYWDNAVPGANVFEIDRFLELGQKAYKNLIEVN